MITDSELQREFKYACAQHKAKKFSNIVLKMIEKKFPYSAFEGGFSELCTQGHTDMVEDFLRVYPTKEMTKESVNKAIKNAYTYENIEIVHMLLDDPYTSTQLNIKEFFSLMSAAVDRGVMEKLLNLNEARHQNLIVSNNYMELTALFYHDAHWVIEHFIDKGYLTGKEPIFSKLFKKYPHKIGNLDTFIQVQIEKNTLSDILPPLTIIETNFGNKTPNLTSKSNAPTTARKHKI